MKLLDAIQQDSNPINIKYIKHSCTGVDLRHLLVMDSLSHVSILAMPGVETRGSKNEK